jgi:hypothetical protein
LLKKLIKKQDLNSLRTISINGVMMTKEEKEEFIYINKTPKTIYDRLKELLLLLAL